MRRADAEADKALKHARMLEERRAAKRASATPLDELEESAMNDDAETSAEAMLVAVEAVLTETCETVEALTVSALQQAHAASHRADVTAESFFQAHKDMTVTTTKKQARKKQLDFLESMKVYEEMCAGELHAGTHVVSGRCVDTMKTPTVWRSKYTARGYEEPHSDEGCSAANEAFAHFWQDVSIDAIRDTKLLWQIVRKLFSTLKSAKESKCMLNHLTGGHQHFCWVDDVWFGKCGKAMLGLRTSPRR